MKIEIPKGETIEINTIVLDLNGTLAVKGVVSEKTKKLIRKKNYFRPGPFEPYLSMEKMTNVEAREYGKRVLTNYVIYLNKLGKPTRLLPFMQTLTDPARTDRFRK